MITVRHPYRYGGMFLALFAVVFLASPMKPDIDTWFLLASGRALDILPSIPVQEPLTIHSGLDFVMEQWLTAYLFWHINQIFSTTGLCMLAFLVALFTGCCYLRLTMQETENFFLAGIVTIFTMRVLGIFMATRPQIFSYLLFTLAFLLLEDYAKNGRGKKALFVGLPVISMLIINLHAGFFPMLICLMLPYLFESITKDTKYFVHSPYLNGKLLLGVFVFMGLAAFCNPYGVKAISYTVASLTSGYAVANVEEMAPLNIHTDIFLPVVVLTGLLIWGYTRHKIPYRFFLLSCGTLLLSFLVVRGAALYFLFSAFQLAYLFRDITEERLVGFLKKPFILFLLASFFLAMVAAKDGDWRSLLLGLLVYPLIFFWHRLPEYKQPRALFQTLVVSVLGMLLVFVVLPPDLSKVQPGSQAAFRALAERTVSPSSIRLYCGYNDGGYAEYLGIRPYIDGRAEVFIPAVNHEKDIFKEWLEVRSGLLYYKDFLARYDFNYLLVRKEDALYYALPNDSDYRMFYDQDGIRVFEKKGEGAEDFAERL